jgi:predicted ATPase
MSFKLLAIRPLDGCNPKFLKNLEENRIYQFYNDYEFVLDENKKEVIEIKPTPTIPNNLYGDKINVSAIVGKNGSGKSALVELLYSGLYNLSVLEGILKKELNEAKKDESLEQVQNKTNELINRIQSKQKLNNLEFNSLLENLILWNSSIEEATSVVKLPFETEYDKLIELEKKGSYFTDDDFENLDKLNKNLLVENHTVNKLKKINTLKNGVNIIVKDIKIEIFFKFIEKNKSNLYSLKVENTVITINKFESNEKLYFNPESLSIEDQKVLLKENFFYSLAVNYSFYALNSNELGLWLKSIFHKNDSYQMPIVLNPMRTKGVIDVNTENELTKSRLLYNLFYPLIFDQQKTSNIINGKIPLKIKLKVNHLKLIDSLLKENVDYLSFVSIEKYSSYIDIIRSVFDVKEIYSKNELQNVCYQYIFNKLYSIISYYQSYKKNEYLIVLKGNEYKAFEKLLIKIRDEDDSHITLKLKQVVMFLKHHKAFISNVNPSDFLNSEFEIIITDYAKSISGILGTNNQNFSQYLLPSFFEIDLFFEDGSNFNQLSSGEKQLIYSTNTILYHILNINSVFKNTDENLRKYNYVNMIYDEIELYYHPDLQKQFLDYLLKEISKLNIENIKGINILFITHSPFILSDIPKQNILYLKTEERVRDNKKVHLSISQPFENKKSFGANITDLLADSFFIDNGLMGDFAKAKIEDTIKWINDKNRDLAKKEYYGKLIDIIDEPLVKHKLREMYFEKFPEEFDKQDQLKKLNEMADKLGYIIKEK